MDSIENRDIVQRVSELEAGAGIGHTNLRLHPCYLFSTELLHQLQLDFQMCAGSKGWVEPLCCEAHVTLVPAGDI